MGAFVIYVVQQISSTFRRLSAELFQEADQVASAASQLSSSSQLVAQGASEQARPWKKPPHRHKKSAP
jgi:methyl-accepting chemotaxis protein